MRPDILWELIEGIEMLPIKICPMSPTRAKKLFLDRFKQIEARKCN
jgi:hypothetical protein